MRKLIAIAIMVGAPAMAREGPSFDCAIAGTAAEELVSDTPELAALDRQFAATYRKALAVASASDTGGIAAAATLKAMQGE